MYKSSNRTLVKVGIPAFYLRFIVLIRNIVVQAIAFFFEALLILLKSSIVLGFCAIQ
jgi:hypothetical protein